MKLIVDYMIKIWFNLIIGYHIKDNLMINLICRFKPTKHTKFKIACAEDGKSMNRVINELVQDFLDKRKAIA